MASEPNGTRTAAQAPQPKKYQQITHPQHPVLFSLSLCVFVPAGTPVSTPFLASAPEPSRVLPRERREPRFRCFFFNASSSSDGGAKERTETWKTVDSGGAARFREESAVSSVSMRPRYRILRKALLGGFSSAQSLGQLLHTVSFNSPIVVLGSNSCVRRRPDTSNSAIETVDPSDKEVIVDSCVCGMMDDWRGSPTGSFGGDGGTREVEGTWEVTGSAIRLRVGRKK